MLMDWDVYSFVQRIFLIIILLCRLSLLVTTDPGVGAGTGVNPLSQGINPIGLVPPQQPFPTTGLNPAQEPVSSTYPLNGTTQQQGNVANGPPNPMQPQTSSPNGGHRPSNESDSHSLSSSHSHRRGRRRGHNTHRGGSRHSFEVSSSSRNHRRRSGRGSSSSRSSSRGSSKITVNGHFYPASCLFTSSFVVWTSRGRRTKVHSSEDRRRVRDYASLCLQWEMKQRDYEQGLLFASTHAAPPPFYNGLQPTSLHQPPPSTWRFPVARPPPAVPEPPCLPECEEDDRHGCSDVMMIDDEEARKDYNSESSESWRSRSRSSSHSHSRSDSRRSGQSHSSGSSSSRRRSSSRGR